MSKLQICLMGILLLITGVLGGWQLGYSESEHKYKITLLEKEMAWATEMQTAYEKFARSYGAVASKACLKDKDHE